MIYWKCENKECTEFGKEIIETRPMFKYTNNGTVPINIPYCKVCGKQMGYREELPESEGDINVAFASFGSQSNENKAFILKDRYKKESRYHCHTVLERILRLAGLPTTADSENLDFICLREYSPTVRISVIDYALRQGKGYGLVIIDGIRDLMLDINSTSESVEVINKMMEWSSRYDLHIHCVLHLNKGDNNVRGHIGTEMSNKAETVLVISKCNENPSVSEVHALHIREKEFKPFAFTVDDNGLPVIAEGHTFGDTPKPRQRTSFTELSIEQHREALSAAFDGKPIRGFENVLQRLIASYENIGFKRGRSVMIKLLQYLTDNLKLVVKQDKLFYYDMTPAEARLFDEE